MNFDSCRGGARQIADPTPVLPVVNINLIGDLVFLDEFRVQVGAWLPRIIVLRVALPRYLILPCNHRTTVIHQSLNFELFSPLTSAHVNFEAYFRREFVPTVEMRTHELALRTCFLWGHR